MGTIGAKCASLPLLALICLGAAGADAGNLLSWKEINGIIQTNNVVGSGTGQVTGGGQPWTTSGGEAHVNLANGRIHFDVRGLVFAGGNTIGTPGAVASVKGTLVCDTDGNSTGGNSVLVDTPLVPLSPTGDALFSGEVTLDPACLRSPDVAFLVRTATGRWIANGAVLHPSF